MPEKSHWAIAIYHISVNESNHIYLPYTGHIFANSKALHIQITLPKVEECWHLASIFKSNTLGMAKA